MTTRGLILVHELEVCIRQANFIAIYVLSRAKVMTQTLSDMVFRRYSTHITTRTGRV